MSNPPLILIEKITYGTATVKLSHSIEDTTSRLHQGWRNSFYVVMVYIDQQCEFAWALKSKKIAVHVYKQYCERLKARNVGLTPDSIIDPAWY